MLSGKKLKKIDKNRDEKRTEQSAVEKSLCGRAFEEGSDQGGNIKSDQKYNADNRKNPLCFCVF